MKDTIFVCGGPNCTQQGSDRILDYIQQRIMEEKLQGMVNVGRMHCFRMCGQGPNILVAPEGIIHSGVTEDKIDTILNAVFDRIRASDSEK